MKSGRQFRLSEFVLLWFLLLPGRLLLAQSASDNAEQARAYAQAGNFREALPLFRGAVSVIHDNPSLEFLYAYSLSQNGEDRAAMEEYRQVVSLNARPPYFGTELAGKQSSCAHLEIGRILERAGKFDEALSEYEWAGQSGNAEAYNIIGVLYFNQFKDYDKALSYFETALRYNPGDAVAKKNIGNCYSAFGAGFLGGEDCDKALACFSKGLQYDPESTSLKANLQLAYDAVVRLGRECQEKKDNDNAIRYLERALPYTPNDPRIKHLLHFAYNAVGSKFMLKKDYAKAIEPFKKSLYYEPDDTTAKVELDFATKKLAETNTSTPEWYAGVAKLHGLLQQILGARDPKAACEALGKTEDDDSGPSPSDRSFRVRTGEYLIEYRSSPDPKSAKLETLFSAHFYRNDLNYLFGSDQRCLAFLETLKPPAGSTRDMPEGANGDSAPPKCGLYLGRSDSGLWSLKIDHVGIEVDWEGSTGENANQQLAANMPR